MLGRSRGPSSSILKTPQNIGAVEIEAFLTHLAAYRNVAASTQYQVLSAILFWFREVIHQPVAIEFQYIGAKNPKRSPVIFTKAEVHNVVVPLLGEPS